MSLELVIYLNWSIVDRNFFKCATITLVLADFQLIQSVKEISCKKRWDAKESMGYEKLGIVFKLERRQKKSHPAEKYLRQRRS